MKRTFICAALLVATAACTSTPPASNNAQPSNANAANANAAATPKAAANVSEADAIAREKQAWDAIKNKDFDGFANMLAEDQLDVSNDGVYDKAGSVKGVKDLTLTDVSFSDWKVLAVDKDAAVVTYTVTLKGTSGGQPIKEQPVRASSAWVNRGGKWLAVYHQSTEVMPAPANPPASKATPTAKPAASPAAPSSTTADVTANENLIWDLLKRKDYDGFASFLASDSLEVEAGGVYDKAGSVKGVSEFDFAGTSLSDFKVVKFDADASLVTYLVKGPAPAFTADGERHSTIWANRDGKWLAVFHQGTPVAKPKAK
jgi:hypothetical protein